LLGGWPGGEALLWVDGQLLNFFGAHVSAELAFDERLHEEADEVEDEERLDAPFVLEQDRRDLVDGLDLLEAFLDGGLSLVRLEDLARGQSFIVRQQRILRRVGDHAASRRACMRFNPRS